MRTLKIICMTLVIGLLAQGMVYARNAEQEDEEQSAVGTTPPRLSFVDGQVSFWRSGTSDWVEAQVNTPLAEGDQLYSGTPGSLELQIGARAFVRAGAGTQVGLENHEQDYIQFKVTAGDASFDIRSIDPGKTVEVDVPNAAFIIERAGYYRVNVDGDHTAFSVRRSGLATLTPADGESFEVGANEEVTVDGMTNPEIDSSRAPEFDQWDRWGLSRTDQLQNAVSKRYVSQNVYGISDLDNAGIWRETPDYGHVWIPKDVPDGWAPYSSGSWVNDPVYGWTWIDTEPWGWAPYHYGRWISVDGNWAWAPGPAVAKPDYAPALVAFFDDQDTVSSRSDDPSVGWVALGWGEPLVPWWGPERFHRPWWGGWGGPRVRDVERTGRYRNIDSRNGMVVVHKNRFARDPVKSSRIGGRDHHGLRPMISGPVVSKTQFGFMPTERRGVRPPDTIVERSVVTTRPSRVHVDSASRGRQFLSPTGRAANAPRIVPAPRPDTIQRRIEVKQTFQNDQPSQPPSVRIRREPVTSQPQRNEFKVQQQQQIHQQQVQQEQQTHQQQIKEQQVRQQQIQVQQVHQQQVQQEQQMHQQQAKEQQVRQQQVQQERQMHQQQIKEQQVRQQQIQVQQVHQQQIQQQQVHQQQIQQQQVHQQQIQQQQVRQQQVQQQKVQQQQVQQQKVQQQQVQQHKGQQNQPQGKQEPVQVQQIEVQ